MESPQTSSLNTFLLGPSTPPSVASTTSIGSHYNSIRARTLAITRFEDNITLIIITTETSISKSSIYKLRSKAISRSWKLRKIVEPKHVSDAPKSGRPKTSTTIALLIIAIVTKNSITKG
jgi:hypothetical protein